MLALERDKEHYLSEFEQFAQARVGKEPGWLQQLRKGAIATLAEHGFPAATWEDWKYTSVTALADIPFKPVVNRSGAERLPSQLKYAGFGAWEGTQLVFINGHFASELSSLAKLPAGSLVGSLDHAIAEAPHLVEPYLSMPLQAEHAFMAINSAFFSDGAVIMLPHHTNISLPVHLLFVTVPGSEPIMSCPRILIVCQSGSQVQVVESYLALASGRYLTAGVTQIVLEERAQLEYYTDQRESPEAFHMNSLQAKLGSNSRFTATSLALGGKLVRSNALAVLAGEGAICTLDGLYVGRDHQHIDYHTIVDHDQPQGTSRQLYKGILDDAARGVFSGRVIVRPDARKSNSQQISRNLLLSRNAEADTRPQLEICADDVKCNHGATIGQLDEDALFYLQSRGIGLLQARRLLTYAFAGDIIESIKIAAVRERLAQFLLERLPCGPEQLGDAKITTARGDNEII
ncbi:MAG: Fe-S cluster assembly protein SufD [Cyanobacteria bacterium NC_groundwater_1444_Ag_S-0.65um_54_12]|nr:Fe-S cluster assembly protein SufD [Cyanobacteria bacterium NC_groundwater_1444_Ag_S-0.65um_54_12]